MWRVSFGERGSVRFIGEVEARGWIGEANAIWQEEAG